MVPLKAAQASLRDDAEGDGGTMVGYPIVFNEMTEIESVWEGTFREQIAPGAVKKTLAERGDRVQVLFNHGFDPTFGDKPLGVPKVQREDKTGLYTEVQLDQVRSIQEEIIPRLRSGSIAGMSFRFSVINEEWNRDTEDGIDERTITELKLYEYGPVTFPAYQATSVGIRSLADYRAYRQELKEAVENTLATEPSNTSLKRDQQIAEWKGKQWRLS